MVWNSAGRQRDLLSGLVNLAEPNNTKMPPPDSPHGQKRSAGSAGIVEEATVPPSAPYTSPQPFPFGQPDANLADTTGFNFQAPPLPELNSGAFPDLFNFMTSAGGTAMMPPPGMLFSQPDSAFSAGEPIGPTHAPQSPSSMWPWLDPTGFPFHPSSHPESHLQTPSYPHMSMPPNNSGLGMSLASSTPSMNTNMSLQHPPLPHPPHPSVKVEQDVLQHTSDLFLQT